jgi:hypothetical protein
MAFKRCKPKCRHLVPHKAHMLCHEVGTASELKDVDVELYDRWHGCLVQSCCLFRCRLSVRCLNYRSVATVLHLPFQNFDSVIFK